SALGGLPITTTVEGRNRFTVNVRYAQDFRTSLDAIRDVTIPLPQGMAPAASSGMDGDARGSSSAGGGAPAQIPLSAVADVRVSSGLPMLRDVAGLLVGY